MLLSPQKLHIRRFFEVWPFFSVDDTPNWTAAEVQHRSLEMPVAVSSLTVDQTDTEEVASSDEDECIWDQWIKQNFEADKAVSEANLRQKKKPFPVFQFVSNRHDMTFLKGSKDDIFTIDFAEFFDLPIPEFAK